MSDVKQIQVTGTAAEEMLKGTSSRGGGGTRKRASRKAKATQEGGGATSPGTTLQVQLDRTGLAATADPVGTDAKLPAGAAPAPVTTAPAPTLAPAPTPQTGGAPTPKPVKVTLAPAKKKTSKVVLAAPVKKVAAALAAAAAAAKPASTKRHVTRKVRVSITGLSKKLTRAKTIRATADKSSLEHVKRVLLKAGLIRNGTKAPETILRQMYADFMMIKNKAL